jgi:hypothetical protein
LETELLVTQDLFALSHEPSTEDGELWGKEFSPDYGYVAGCKYGWQLFMLLQVRRFAPPAVPHYRKSLLHGLKNLLVGSMGVEEFESEHGNLSGIEGGQVLINVTFPWEPLSLNTSQFQYDRVDELLNIGVQQLVDLLRGWRRAVLLRNPLEAVPIAVQVRQHLFPPPGEKYPTARLEGLELVKRSPTVPVSSPSTSSSNTEDGSSPSIDSSGPSSSQDSSFSSNSQEGQTEHNNEEVIALEDNLDEAENPVTEVPSTTSTTTTNTASKSSTEFITGSADGDDDGFPSASLLNDLLDSLEWMSLLDAFDYLSMMLHLKTPSIREKYEEEWLSIPPDVSERVVTFSATRCATGNLSPVPVLEVFWHMMIVVMFLGTCLMTSVVYLTMGAVVGQLAIEGHIELPRWVHVLEYHCHIPFVYVWPRRLHEPEGEEDEEGEQEAEGVPVDLDR